MAKDRRKRELKRWYKKPKKDRKPSEPGAIAPPQEVLAYMGEKYRTDKLVPVWMQTEIGIYETFVMTDEKLLDKAVVSAIEKLVRQLQAGKLPPLSDSGEIRYEAGKEDDFMIENIRRRWALHFEDEWQPPKDKLIGVLRSILGSIEKVRSPGPYSQSYMRHIAGFLTKKLGVSVRRVSADMRPLPAPKEDELVLLGRQWIEEKNQDAKAEFYQLAGDLISDEQAARVIGACHQLIGEKADPKSKVLGELIELRNQAQRATGAIGGAVESTAISRHISFTEDT